MASDLVHASASGISDRRTVPENPRIEVTLSNAFEVIQVTRTRLLLSRKGAEEDIPRVIEQYWSMDGKLIFAFDPQTGNLFYRIHENFKAPGESEN